MLIGGKQTFAFEMGFAHIEYENQDNCLNENVFFFTKPERISLVQKHIAFFYTRTNICNEYLNTLIACFLPTSLKKISHFCIEVANNIF